MVKSQNQEIANNILGKSCSYELAQQGTDRRVIRTIPAVEAIQLIFSGQCEAYNNSIFLFELAGIISKLEFNRTGSHLISNELLPDEPDMLGTEMAYLGGEKLFHTTPILQLLNFFDNIRSLMYERGICLPINDFKQAKKFLSSISKHLGHELPIITNQRRLVSETLIDDLESGILYPDSDADALLADKDPLELDELTRRQLEAAEPFELDYASRRFTALNTLKNACDIVITELENAIKQITKARKRAG